MKLIVKKNFAKMEVKNISYVCTSKEGLTYVTTNKLSTWWTDYGKSRSAESLTDSEGAT